MSRLAPTFDPDTNQIRIPRVSWATYYVGEERVSGVVVIDSPTTVTAKPNPPSHFQEDAVTEWTFTPGVVSSEETQTLPPPPPPSPEAPSSNLD